MFPTMIFLGDLLVIIVVMLAGFILPASARVQIFLFQGLSGVLVMLTLWTMMISGSGWSILLTMIPIGLAVFINPLASYILGSGTIAPLSLWQRITYSLLGLGLIALVFAVTPHLPTIIGGSIYQRLPAVLALVLVGLCSWLVRKDLISQAIGLLVMDDGLLLLSESVIHRMELAGVLLFVLFLYLLVPLTCLLLVMPRLRQTTLECNVDQFRKLRG